MRLTEEQHLLVEAAQGKPVDVLDPRTDRSYVLLPAEHYQRFKDLEEGRGVAEPAPTTHGVSGTPSPAPAPNDGPLRVALRALPTPSEVAAIVQKRCQELGVWRRKYVQEVEDEFKLQYYYGGRCVAYLRTSEGPVIVAAGRRDSDAFDRQLSYLTTEERYGAIRDWPSPWNDPATSTW
jgi:hypothetical protein